jgi:exopolysaccharide biosynthesis protein
MQLYTGLGRTMNLSEEPLAYVSEITAEYGRASGANYCLLRIPRFTSTGKRVMPKVALAGGKVGKASAVLTYAKQQKALCVVNAGLFNASSLYPLGRTVIDGVSVTNTTVTSVDGVTASSAECYPLCIDANGDLSAPYNKSVGTSNLIANGVVHAVTGFGQLIGNFSVSTHSKFNEVVYAAKNIRQCIGQYENGDYMICTVDGMYKKVAPNDAGMTYTALASLLQSRGVKFAYVLDGGNSTQTVLGRRLVNPVYEGTEGRPVATVIRFDVVDA